MKISAHLGKISWSLADKALYVFYGLIQFIQIKVLPVEVFGVFGLLVGLNTWIMIVSDGSALAGIIQFGVNTEERARINSIAAIIHLLVVGVPVMAIYLLQQPLAILFNEPQFVLVATMLPIFCLLTFPRMFCLKLIYRDMRMRDLFIIDSIWFGVRAILTGIALKNNTLQNLNDLLFIDFVGMGASSLAAIVFTRKDLVFGWKGAVNIGTYLKYGLPLAAATALNSAPRQLESLVIFAFFGPTVNGFYTAAKTLYRIFEQAFDAVVALLYPAAVRMFAAHRTEDLQILVTKVISFTLIPTLVVVAAVELGAGKLILPLLGEKYANAVTHFNVLTLAALGMPFVLMSSVVAAMGRSMIVVLCSAIGLVISGIVLFAVGFSDAPNAVGLGLVTNTIVVGILCTLYVRKTIHFPISALGRAFYDVRHEVLARLGKSK